MNLDELKVEMGKLMDQSFELGKASINDETPFSQADLDKAAQDAKAELKAQVLAKLEAQQANENASEMSLKAELESL